MKRRSIGNRSFRKNARRIALPNRWIPMRGGIRF